MNALFIVQPDFLVSHVGVRRVILYYIAALKREGHQVKLAALKDGKLQCLLFNTSSSGQNTLHWTDRPVQTGEYSTIIITNPWLCAEGLPDLPGCIGIVYDMIPNLIATGCLRFSNSASIFGFAHAHDVGYRYYMRNARRICCISESTRQDFLELYGPIRNDIDVVAHVPFEVKRSSVVEAKGTRVLLVNALDARKNLSGMADILEKVHPVTPIQLDIVGQARSSRAVIANFFSRLKKAGIQHNLYQDISNEKLQSLYQNASVLLFPSLYEGLGLPVLEAQQEGIPAITTNNSSLPEINLNPSLCFRLDDSSGMALALTEIITHRRKVLRGEPLRTALVALMTRQPLVSNVFSPGPMPVPTAGETSSAGQGISALGSPAELEKQPIPEVAWEGSFLDYGSLSTVNRALTDSLVNRFKLTVTRVGNSTVQDLAAKRGMLQTVAKQLRPKSSTDAKITVRHQWPPDWSRSKQGALIIMQPWEFGTLPEDWVRQASEVDEFWAYTNYVRQVYISSGIDAAKVKVVPLGIDPTAFRPDVAPFTLATTKRFKFLFVGGTISRKGPDVLLKAYLGNFTAADDVCLVIKDFGGNSVYAGQTLEAHIKEAQARPGAPEILYLNEELPPEALPSLYTACDSLVHPYRGEGFGLPVLEAMACGLPVIVTAGGSTDDFATDEFAYRIPAAKQFFGDTISGMKLVGKGWMLEPSVPALGDWMKWVVTHQEEARALGSLASDHVRREWTWERSAVIAKDRLQAIAARQNAHPSISKIPTSRKPTPAVLPLVAKVGELTNAQELFRKKSPRAAWEAAREAIKARPHHPEAFLLLAEIARMVGTAAAARSCAEHALALAPAFKPAKKFLKANFHGTTNPDWLALPPEIENKNTKAKPRVSACLIVKNEERFIGQCLSSLKGLVDQIVVVDTGSTDHTIAIAKEHGAEIHAFEWCNDFSAARNAALQYVTGDWIFSLDADEELLPESHPAFRRLLENDSVISWRLPLFDIGRENEGNNYVPRLFRNAPGLHFVGRIHEQIFYSVEARRTEWGLENRIGDATLRHYGYTKELIQERGKVERNLRLLEQAITEITTDPLLFMNYGLELCRSNRVEEGLLQYQIAFEMMSQQPASSVTPETREALLTQYSTHLRIGKRPAEVLPVLNSPLARSGDLTASQHFVLGLAHMELEQFPAAAQQMRHCLAKREMPTFTPINPDIRTAIPRHSIALCLWHAKDSEGAEEAFQAAIAEAPNAVKVHIDYARFLHGESKTPESLRLLNQLVTDNPKAVEAWVAGGKIALSQPNLLEVAVDWTAVAVNHHPKDATILAQRAEALFLAGQLQEALPLWAELASQSTPRILAARIFCETVLGIAPSTPPSFIIATVSQEFDRWYWRLVEFGAEPTILQLHTSVDALHTVLPDAARSVYSIIAKLSLAEAV